MTIPSILCEARVAITPMNGGIRFGGTMEIGKINKQVNMNRVKELLNQFPNTSLNLSWMSRLKKTCGLASGHARRMGCLTSAYQVNTKTWLLQPVMP